MKFAEKLTLLITTFIIVCISTGAIIGNYVKVKNNQKNRLNNSVILENINLF